MRFVRNPLLMVLGLTFILLLVAMFHTFQSIECENERLKQQKNQPQQQQQQTQHQHKRDRFSFGSSELDLPSVDDLIAMVFWEQNNTEQIWEMIKKEQVNGKRDKYFLPKSYVINAQNKHFDDTEFTDEYQKDVYMIARELARNKRKRLGDNNKKVKVIDVGCGSGFKLVNYIAPEFDTVGLETEPALTHLRTTYPKLTWIDSGKPEEELPKVDGTGESVLSHCDVAICADVIEHIRDPDALIEFLKSLSCEVYVISTPKRELMSRENGPPSGGYHVREWAFHEFQLYLMSMGFKLVRSYDGVQNPTTQMHVVRRPDV